MRCQRPSNKPLVGCFVLLLLLVSARSYTIGISPEEMTKDEIIQELIENSIRIDSLLSQQEENLSQSKLEYERFQQDLRILTTRQVELLKDLKKHEERLVTLERDQQESLKISEILESRQSELEAESKGHTETIVKLQSSQNETLSSFESYKSETDEYITGLEKELKQLKIRNAISGIAALASIVLAATTAALK